MSDYRKYARPNNKNNDETKGNFYDSGKEEDLRGGSHGDYYDRHGLSRPEQLPPEETEDTGAGIGTRVSDVGKAVAQGANQLAQGGFDIWKNTGGYLNKALSAPIKGAETLTRALGKEDAADFFEKINIFAENEEWFDRGEAEELALTEIFKENNQIYESIKSDDLKSRKAALEEEVANAPDEVSRAWATFKGSLSDPALTADFLAKQVPMFTGIGAVGRAGAIVGGAKAGTAAAVGTGALMQGGSVATETYEGLLEQAPELWAVNDKYIDLLNQGMGEDEARKRISVELKNQTFLGATAISVIANMLPGARALEKSLVGVKLNPGAGGMLGRAVGGAVGEGVSEAIEEGSGVAIGNLAKQQINPDQEISEGVGRAAGEGALAFIPGAAGGATQRSGDVDVNDTPTKPEPSDAQTQGSVEKDASQSNNTSEPTSETPERKVSRETEPSAEYSGEERRSDVERRKRIASMTNEDIENELYRNELTGIKNRRAFEEDRADSKEIVSVDLDGLASANDYGSMQAGDDLLSAAGKAFEEVFAEDAYHISGDEFYILNPGADLDDKMAKVREIMAQSKIETSKNGKKVVIEGVDFSYGKGLSKDEADSNMKKSKVEREKAGQRTPRKELPSNMKYFDDQGNQLPARLNEASELVFDGPTATNDGETSNERSNSTEAGISKKVQQRQDGNERVAKDSERLSTRSGNERGVKRPVNEKRNSDKNLAEIQASTKSRRRVGVQSEPGKQAVRLNQLASESKDRVSFENAARAQFGPGQFNKMKALGDIEQAFANRKPVTAANSDFIPEADNKKGIMKEVKKEPLKKRAPDVAQSFKAQDVIKLKMDSGEHYSNNKNLSDVRRTLINQAKDVPAVSKAQSLVKKWSSKYGGHNVGVIDSDQLSSLTNLPLQNIAYINNLDTIAIDKGIQKAIDGNFDDSNFAASVEILAHEFAHSLQVNEYYDAPRSIRKAIANDFSVFREKTLGLDEAIKTYPPAFAKAFSEGDLKFTGRYKPEPRDIEYVSKFHEWLANRIAHYLVKDTVENSVSLPTKSWIKKTAEKLKVFYNNLFASGFYDFENSPKSIKAFMKHASEKLVEKNRANGTSDQKVPASSIAIEANDPIFMISPATKGESIESLVARGPNKTRNPNLAELNTKRLRDFNIPVSKDGLVKLGHYSNVKDLTKTDPSRHGDGIKGAESSRKIEDDWVDRTYFGLPGYEKERGLGPETYTAVADVSNIYDVANDYDNLISKAYTWDKYGQRYRENTNSFEKAVKDAGYDGIFNPRTKMIMMFGPTDVQPWANMGNKVPSETLPEGYDPQSATVEYWTNGISLDDSYTIAGSEEFSKNRDLKVKLQEEANKLLKSKGLRYENKPPVKKPGLTGEAGKKEANRIRRAKLKFEKDQNNFINHASKMVVKDTLTALKGNSNAIGWYDRTVTEAMDVLSLIHPEIKTDANSDFAFKYALAVTSNGMRVNKNFEIADRAYSYFKEHGKMPEDVGIGTAAPAINEGMKIFNNMVADKGIDSFRQWMNGSGKVKDLIDAGFKIGGESKSLIVPNASILGPKIGGGFFSNLNGRFDQLTMDRWLMRSWGRWSGTLIDTRKDMIKEKSTELRNIAQGLSEEQRKSLSEIIETPVGGNISAPKIASIALATQKASIKTDKRKAINDVSPDFRKTANSLAKWIDGQKEAPKNASERNIIRDVFSDALTELKKDYPDLTMADLQAVLWYAERRLYDSSKSSEKIESYSDDEAPDYANAAAKLAVEKGISKEDIKNVRRRPETDVSSANARRGSDKKSNANKTTSSNSPGARRKLNIDSTGVTFQPVDRYGSKAGTHLEGLSDSVNMDGKPHKFTGLKSAQKAAKDYAKKAGLPFKPVTDYQPVNVERAERIAQAFEDMVHEPENPKVKAAYRALIDETYAQYEAMLEAGVKIEFMPGDGDVYGNPRNAILDVVENNHMYVFSTRKGFGSNESFDPSDNPLLEESPFTFGKEPALANDIFRAVHDYFGHIRNGVGFRAGGEENAWRSHASMYTPLARLAATTETRGQNSWVNYGPHGETNRTASADQTVFADQKIGILPEWTMEDNTMQFFQDHEIESQTASKNIDPNKPLSAIKIEGTGALLDYRNLVTKPLKRNKGKLKRFWKRNLTTQGLLSLKGIVPDSVFASVDTPFQNKIKSDGGKAVGEKEIAIFQQELRNAMYKDHGRNQTNDLWEKANEYLSGSKVTVGSNTKDVLDAMRSYLDGLSDAIMDSIKDRIILAEDKLTPEQMADYLLALNTNGADGKIPVELQRHIEMLGIIDSNKGQYLNRSYAAFDDSKWTDHVRNERLDLIKNAEDFIAKENPDLSPEEVSGAVSAILKRASDTSDITGFMSRGQKYGSKDVRILKQKKEIPSEIRELLGEHKDIRVNFSKSATKMNYLVMNHKFLMNLRNSLTGMALFEKPTKFSDDRDFNTRIAVKGSDSMHPLDGMYTTEDFNQGLVDMMETSPSGDIAKAVMATNSLVKYGKTIISPATQIANFLSGFWFVTGNGHLLNFTGLGKGYNVAVADLAGENAFGRFITKKGWKASDYNGYIRDLIAKGVLHDNPNASEMRKAIEDFMEFKTTKEGPMHPRKILEFMQRSYQLGDDFWKVIGYESEKASKLKAGVKLEDAERIASERIRNGYPTYSMVPRLVQQIRRWYLVGTFVSFPYEMGRTTVNQYNFLKEDWKTDKPAFTRRLLGLAIAHSAFGAASYLSYTALGMDSEDDEAVRALLPPWSRNSTLLYTGFDENGMPTFVDLTRYNPYAYVQKPIQAMVNGNNEGAWEKIKDSVKEISEPFIGAEITVNALIELYTNKRVDGFGTVSNEADSTWRQYSDKFNHLRRNMQPTIITQLENVWKAHKGEASGSRQRVVKDELLAIAGYRSMTMNVANSLRYKTYDFSQGKRDSTYILSRVAKKGGTVTEKELTSAYYRMEEARERAYRKMIRNVNIAKQLGMSNEEIRTLLRASRISIADTAALLKGEVPSWKMSNRFMKQSGDLAVLTAAGKERKSELAKQTAERKRLIQNLVKEKASKENR